MGIFDKFHRLAADQRALIDSGVNPFNVVIERLISATEAIVNGRHTILAGTNNYLGLTFNPQCIEAAKEAVQDQGTGTTGSRMANGTYAGHAALEREFADFFEVSTHYGKDELKPLVSTIVKYTDKPVFRKLSPHVEDYIGFISEAIKYGASGVVAVNSVGPGLVVDLKRKAVTIGLDGGKSWISGPAIKPIALNRVMNIRRAFPDLPIIATGGVASAEDVLEFILAGADLVQMLSSALINGRKTYDEIIDKLPKVMEKYDIESIESLRKTELDIKPQGIGGNPIINHDKCTKCMLCVRICPEMALSFTDKIEVDKTICMKCGLCESRCPVEAISGVL